MILDNLLLKIDRSHFPFGRLKRLQIEDLHIEKLYIYRKNGPKLHEKLILGNMFGGFFSYRRDGKDVRPPEIKNDPKREEDRTSDSNGGKIGDSKIIANSDT